MAVDLSISSGRIALRGALTALTLGPLWPRALRAAGEAAGGPLEIDLSAVDRLDSSGAALILAMERRHGGAVSLSGANEEVSALLAQLRAVAPATQAPMRATAAPRMNITQDLRVKVEFFGETVLSLFALHSQLRMLRRADFFRIAERAGLQALPLVLTLGFLIGMILAFQSAVPMRQFGADLYVADLVTLSLCRELGPLMVAVILAGRTGSAYAAELGTMQVNDEIAALTTMNISPVSMLVLPRIGAAMLVMPALIVAINAAGLAGMTAVLTAFGFPLSAIAAHIAIHTAARNFVMGLCKGVVFAAMVALIGCRAGLTAKGGPRAVGESATAAVVGGIVVTVVLDGIFSVIFYRLNL
ncbi:MAG TPA: ABC transporter permease [Acidocella sp.]|nr:ABC transporter permease [Acidocella sp.]